jgi:hypothetical protein
MSGGTRLIIPDNNLVNNTQKNWLPFIDQKTLSLCSVFCTGPTLCITQIDDITGLALPFKQYKTNLSFHQTRGGSPIVPFEFESFHYMYTVHCSFDQPNIRRKYLHRFVFLGKDYEPLAISESFFIFGDSPSDIEFIISCTVNRKNPNVYLFGVGRNDVEAWIVSINKDDILRLKKYLI